MILYLKKIPLFFIILTFITYLISGCGAGGGGVVNEPVQDYPSLLKNISVTTIDSTQPTVFADSKGNVYIAWKEGGENTKKVIYLMSSQDAGVNYSQKKLEDFYNTHPTGTAPHVNISKGGDIFVVWEEDNGSKKDIFYKYSKDHGTTFLPADWPVNISTSPAEDSEEPLLGFEGSLMPGFEGSLNSNINAVWVEESAGGDRWVTFSRSANSGASFLTPQPLPESDKSLSCPNVATSPKGDIYVAYKGSDGIHFTLKPYNTQSFYGYMILSENALSPSCPEIGVGSGGIIFVVWSDNGGIWVTTSTNGGHSFTTPVDISSSEGTSTSPQIAMDNNDVNLVWVEEAIGGGDIFFAGSVDNGDSFSAPKNLSNSASPSLMPSIAADGKKNIFVVWAEGNEGERDIYFLRDKGAGG